MRDDHIRLLEDAGEGATALWLAMQEIHRTFGTPAPDRPELQSRHQVVRRAKWTNDEVFELLEANDIVEQADAYSDIMVFALGGLVELGVDPGFILQRVLKSQFDKIWPDGKAHVDADGKWVKPEGWIAPDEDIRAEILGQFNAS